MKFKILEAISGTSSGTGIIYGALNFDLIFGRIVLVASFVSTVLLTVLKVIDWYKKSKDPNSKGGEKITIDEFKEGVEIVKNGVDEVKNHIDQNENKE